MDSKNPHSYYKVTPQKKNQRPMNGTHLFCVFKAFGDCHSFPSSHLARRPVWQIDSEDPSRIGGSEAANITWGRWGSLKPFATRRQGRCRFHQEPGNLKKKKDLYALHGLFVRDEPSIITIWSLFHQSSI